MISNNFSDDSDSGSLPDLSQLFKVPSPSISKGDIVWAKFRGLYWPALVRTVYPKQKKISIWYTDEPGKTFKLPLKNVVLFHDHEKTAKIKKDVREAGCAQEHEGLTSHARTYLLRRSEGRDDDPMKFFDQTYPFFLAEELQKKNPEADVSNLKIPPLYITREKKQSIRKTINVRKAASDDSEVESTDSEGLHGESTTTADYLTKVNVHLQENLLEYSKKEYVDKIVSCILSGKADNYLQKIMLKSMPSEHQDIYERSLKCNKKSVSNITYTGPVEDDDNLRKLIFYLLPFYEKMGYVTRSKRSTAKKGRAVSTYSSYNNRSEGGQYVASVWLPESIIFAISVIENVSLPKAKQLFNEKSEHKTKAIESILGSLDTLFPETGETDSTSKSGKTGVAENYDKNEQPEAVKHSSDAKICSPLKKMRVYRSETVKDDENITKDLEFSHEDSELSDDLKSVGGSYVNKRNNSGSDTEVEGHTSEASDLKYRNGAEGHTCKASDLKCRNGAKGHTSEASDLKLDDVAVKKSSKKIPRKRSKKSKK